MSPSAEISEQVQACRQRAVVSLAGPAGSRRVSIGSSEGFKKLLTLDAVTAAHESSHILAGLKYGLCPVSVSIRENRNIRIGKNGVVGGMAVLCDSPEPPTGLPETLDSDLHNAVKNCALIVMAHGQQPTWRRVLSLMRDLRREARLLVETHWLTIQAISIALEQRGVLDAAEIAVIVGRKKIAV